MAARSHLSIGEVLSLLREEFPDITISKIRFLESQGLVDPERTPSGYRKFYEHDVERLRWILRQQRENFLPLKVIKGRLTESGPEGGEGPDAEQLAWETGAMAVTADALPAGTPAEGGAGPTDVARRDRPGGAGTGPAAGDPAAGDPPAGPDDDGPVAADPAGTRTAIAPSHVAVEAGSVPEGPHPPAPSPPGAATAQPTTAQPATPQGATPQVAAPAPTPAASAAASSSAVAPDPAAGRPPASPGGRAPTPPNGGGDDEVDSYTAAELAAAAGVELALVKELQGFGLLHPQSGSGGAAYFDADGLEVVRMAAAFGRHGVEARHLRAWKTSAEREASLFEQVIMPLLHQRNPQARRQALETLEELAGLGAELRDVLVRQALRSIR